MVGRVPFPKLLIRRHKGLGTDYRLRFRVARFRLVIRNDIYLHDWFFLFGHDETR
jgi:hypothetical protein